MSDPNTTQDRAIQHYRWILMDALRHASGVAARSQEATEGTDATILFNEARKAIVEFAEDHPAMRALADASFRRKS